MAKKIRLDFSKTEERSGWNTRSIPDGLHKMKVEAVQETEASDGTDMLVYALVPTDPRYKSRRFPYYCKLQQNQYWKLRDLLVAAGQKVPQKAVSIDPGVIVGKLIAAEVEDESNANYAGRSVVQGTYGLDILDEDGDSSPADDEEEEYEGDEGDEEVEEDEEDEDLSALSLAELRKMAKGLGIDTAGVKKDDLISLIEEESDEDEDDEEDDDLDEDDLEDEELEDEEFEDDEEEEEPAPKRRAAPARKAAPAKRTVRRR